MTDALLEKLKRFAALYDMLPEGGTALCAVSGGTDSMCLLHALKSLGVRVIAAHFNHCLRGEESDGDEEFVGRWCAQNGVPFLSARGDVAAYAEENRVSTEEAARILRYRFLERAADDSGAAVIATAHNANDNSETLLLNIARGTGLKGLCGIPPKRGRIVRPLLECTRDEIESYMRANAIPHVEDSTNRETVYTRNRLRHLVLPALREINPAFDVSVARLTALLREDESCLDEIARAEFEKAKIADREGAARVQALKELAPALRSRALRMLAAGSGGYMDAAQTQAADSLLFSSRPSGETDISGGVRLRREYDALIAEKREAENGSFTKVTLETGKRSEIKELQMTIICESGVNSGKIHKTFNNFLFKKSAIRGKITVRPREGGDYIRLSGRNAGKSLKKLFIEKRIPAAKRARIPVFADESGVIAVYGVGISERVEPEINDEVIIIRLEDGTVC